MPAASSAIGYPWGIATDPGGNLYISSASGGAAAAVLEVTGGKLFRVAGAGTTFGGVYFGDGGPATLAIFSSSRVVGVDAAGEIFIPDYILNYIYKVDASGIVTKIAGNGAVDAQGKCGFDGDGPALEHSLCGTTQVLPDGNGNLLIADLGNCRIRKIDSQGNLTTIAGTGATIYGTCPVFDGDGPATSHALDPAGIALDSHGNLYISDETNNRVRKLDSGGNMATVAGNGSASFSGDGGPATSASLYAPQGVAVDGAGNLYIMDTANLRVRKVDTNGNISTVAGTGNTQGCTVGSGPALHVDVCGEWVAADAAGNLYVDYTNEYMVSKIDTAGNIAPFAGGSGFQDSANGALATQEMLFEPKFLATDANGIVYFAGVQSSVRKIATDGTVTEAVPSQSVSAVDGMGNLYWANGPSNEVVEVDASGAATTVAGTGQPGTCIFNGDGAATTHNVCDPSGAAVDSSGSLFIADTNNCRVRKVDSTGNMTTVAGNGSCTYNGDGAATAFSLNLPAAVAVDPAGNVFVADTANNRVREISTDGTMTTIGGNGMLLNGQCAFDGDGPATQHSVCSPNSIAVGPSGNVFVLDSGNVRVRMISDGNMTTLAGNGQSGFTGENDPASTAILDHPAAIASDPSGNIYIADQFNNRIRKISQISTFIVSAGQPMVTLKAGGSGAVTLQVTAANGFSGTVSFSCSGAPEGATCTPSPGSVSISGGSASTTFTVTTTAASAIARVFHSWAGTLGMWWWVFAFVIVAAIVSRPKRRIAFAFAMAALTLMPACGGSTPPGGGGGGGGVSPTPKGSYTLTLTTVAGSTTQTTTVKLNVQ